MGWFDRSKRWPVVEQLAMAGAVVLVAAAAASVGLRAVRRTTFAPADAGDVNTTAEPLAAQPTSTTTSDINGWLLARNVLDNIPIDVEHPAGYSRDFFVTWSPTGQQGCDVRNAVLVTESLSTAVVLGGCVISSGEWFSTYDAATATDPSQLDIDHVVPLKEAWDSGGWSWTPARRTAYANDLTDERTLIAVTASSNRSKGDKDPSNWLPRTDDVCRYVGDWVVIKARWQLTMDQSEWGRVKNLLEGQCIGIRLAPWVPAPT